MHVLCIQPGRNTRSGWSRHCTRHRFYKAYWRIHRCLCNTRERHTRRTLHNFDHTRRIAHMHFVNWAIYQTFVRTSSIYDAQVNNQQAPYSSCGSEWQLLYGTKKGLHFLKIGLCAQKYIPVAPGPHNDHHHHVVWVTLREQKSRKNKRIATNWHSNV